jgi:hypothetical protein
MVTQDVIFAATGVTDGSILAGIKREPGFLTTETILMRSKTGSVRRMTLPRSVTIECIWASNSRSQIAGGSGHLWQLNAMRWRCINRVIYRCLCAT